MNPGEAMVEGKLTVQLKLKFNERAESGVSPVDPIRLIIKSTRKTKQIFVLRIPANVARQAVRE
jgi:hypothetical protein